MNNNFSTTSSTIIQSSFTLETLENLIDKFFPKLYYAESQFVEKGILYLIKETKFNPEYIVFNSEDKDKIREYFNSKRTLIHVSKYKPDWTKFISYWGDEQGWNIVNVDKNVIKINSIGIT